MKKKKRKNNRFTPVWLGALAVMGEIYLRGQEHRYPTLTKAVKKINKQNNAGPIIAKLDELAKKQKQL